MSISDPGGPRYAVAFGETVGAYEILAPLGAGGMGELSTGHDAQAERPEELSELLLKIAAE